MANNALNDLWNCSTDGACQKLLPYTQIIILFGQYIIGFYVNYRILKSSLYPSSQTLFIIINSNIDKPIIFVYSLSWLLYYLLILLPASITLQQFSQPSQIISLVSILLYLPLMPSNIVPINPFLSRLLTSGYIYWQLVTQRSIYFFYNNYRN